MSSNIKIERICEFCGCSFEAKTTRTRFCGPSCNGKFNKRKAKEKKIAESDMETTQRKQALGRTKDFTQTDVLTVTDAAKYMSVSRRTIYNWLNDGKIKGKRVSDKKVLILKSNLVKYLEDCEDYYRPSPKEKIVTEFYTLKEIREKFNVSLSWIYVLLEKHRIRKTKRSGIVYLSKEDIDSYFDQREREIKNITEWYAIDEIVLKYGLTRDAIYGKCKTYGIPKKKEGRYVKISKKHFDQLYKIEL